MFFVDLISSKHFMVSNPFLSQRKFKNSSMLPGSSNTTRLLPCARVWLAVGVGTSTPTSTFLAPFFALVRPNRKGHIIQMNPASDSDSRVQQYIYPHRRTVKVVNCHIALKRPALTPQSHQSCES